MDISPACGEKTSRISYVGKGVVTKRPDVLIMWRQLGLGRPLMVEIDYLVH